MDTPEKHRNYKFNFWKDGFWAWALVLPLGLITWAIPFVSLFGLMNTDNAPGWFPIFGFVFLSLPAYLVGWIFVYSLMEGLYTKVTITDNWVSVRLPWLVFPGIPIVKRITLEQIHRIDLFAPYGSRTAVFLYYFKKDKVRHFYLPRFKDNPPYIEEVIAIQKRVESIYPSAEGGFSDEADQMKAKNELLQQRIPRFNGRPIFIQRVIHLLYGFVLLGIAGISAWITSSLPPGGIDAIGIGFVIGFIFSWFGMFGMYPVVGQILIWFFGRLVISMISGFFFHLSPNSIYWDTPESVNKIFSQFNIQPVHASFTDFLFWSILIFSILISLDNTIGKLRRRAQKRQMGT